MGKHGKAQRAARAQHRGRRLVMARRILSLPKGTRYQVYMAAAECLKRRWPDNDTEGDALLASLCKQYNDPGRKPRLRPKTPHAASDEFLRCFAWRQLRMIVLKKHGACCQCCGATPPDVVIHVDHIKPRRKYPELALVESNLQVLCDVCNHGKGSWDETDWRPSGTTQGELRGLPVPGTATATSKVSAFSPRLVRRN